MPNDRNRTKFTVTKQINFTEMYENSMIIKKVT